MQVWDGHDGGHVLIYHGHTLVSDDLFGDQVGAPQDVAWSPDGTRIASAGNQLLIWDAVTGGTLSTSTHATGPLAWPPDGAHIAFAADDNTVQIIATP